jgi:hypothetical protein
MNFKDLNNRKIKKALGAKSVCFRWHNKNKGVSNFGISVGDINGVHYELCGYYDKTGKMGGLCFGYIFHAGKDFKTPDTLEDLIVYLQGQVEILEAKKKGIKRCA